MMLPSNDPAVDDGERICTYHNYMTIQYKEICGNSRIPTLSFLAYSHIGITNTLQLLRAVCRMARTAGREAPKQSKHATGQASPSFTDGV